MSTNRFYLLSGLLLLMGGATASYAHFVHPPAPNDPAMLYRYASVSQPAHLLLFGGTVLVLLGLPGLYMQQGRSGDVLGFVGFFFLYLGILFADLLHCILEFSIFPVLMRSIPYATISIVETTYGSTPLAILQAIGRWLVWVGTPISAIAVVRSRVLPTWAGLPLFFATILMVASLLQFPARAISPQLLTSVYLSLAVLGLAMLLKAHSE